MKALEALDPKDPRFTSVALLLTNLMNRSKMVDKAEPILKKSVEQQQTAGVPPILRITLMSALVDTESLKRDAAALESAEAELVKVWIAAVGPDQPVVANNLVRLAQTQERNAKFADANASLEQAVAIMKKAIGPDDPSVGYALSSLSRVQMRAGQKDAAVESAKTAKVIMEKTVEATAVTAGNGVTFPKILSRKEPEYTEEARKSRIQGSILLSLVVGEDGIPRNVHVLIPLGAGLDAKALDAVKTWKFEPGTKNDEPVSVRATIEVNLRLL